MGYGVRPLCGRRVVWWWCDPKLRSAYLGLSGVSPLRGFIAAVAAGYRLWVMGCDRYAAVGWWGGVTPSCAPLTWGSLECRRRLLQLKLQVIGYEVRGYGVRLAPRVRVRQADLPNMVPGLTVPLISSLMVRE